jgi:transposase
VTITGALVHRPVKESLMRICGLDGHRAFAEVAVLDKRGVRSVDPIDLTAEALHEFGRQLAPDGDLVLDSTCNSQAIAQLLRAYVRRVVLAKQLQTCAAVEARVTTDKIEAAVGQESRRGRYGEGR